MSTPPSPLSPAVVAVVNGQIRSVSIGSLYSIAEGSEPISENDEIQSVLDLQSKGDSAFRAKDYLEAIKFYSDALEIDEQKVEVLSARAAVYLEVRQYELAQKDAEHLVKLNPLIPQGHYLRAVSLDNQGHYDSAITSFLNALDHDGEHEEQLVDNITVVAANLCHFPEDVIKGLEDMSPLQKLVEVGVQLQKDNHHDLCIDVLTRAIQMTPDKVKHMIKGLFALASSYLTLKDLVKAKNCFMQCLSLAISEEDVEFESQCYVNLANVYLLENEIPQAIAYYEKLLSIGDDLKDKSRDGEYPEYWSIELRCALHQNLSVAYKEIRNYPRALHHTLAHLELVQSSEDVETLLPLAHHNAGLYYEMVKDFSSALKHHQDYLALAKAKGDKVSMATAYASLGRVYRILCNFKLAESYLEQHLHMADKVRDYDRQAGALCSLGELNLAKEDFDKALSYFERYLRVSRRLDEYETECRAFLKIGDVFKCQGRYQHAQYYYEMAAVVSEKLDNNVDLVNLCRCEVAFALTLSILKEDMEKARLVFEELIPFYTKKIQKYDDESIECPEELKAALQNCFDGLQIALCKLDQPDAALGYAEAYRQQKFEQILKQKLSTEEEGEEEVGETSKTPSESTAVPSQEELIKIVNRQKATVLYYSVTDAYLLVWVLQPGKGVVKVQVERAIRESCRAKIRGALGQLQQMHERQNDMDCENRALPSRDRTVKHLQRKNLAKSKEWKTKEMKKDAEREDKVKVAKLSPQRQLYEIIIAPVEKALAGVSEILLVPDKEISQVPVDLLEDERNVKMNEKFHICCVPSVAVLNSLTKETPPEEKEQKAKKSYHEFFPLYLDDHLRVVVPPDERPLSPIRRHLRTAPQMAREKNINPSMITFGRTHYDHVPTPRERQDRAQIILAREKAKVGTLITHSSTNTEVSTGEGTVTEFHQESQQHRSLVIGNPTLPKKLKLHGQIWQPAGELMVSQCEAFNVAEYLDTKALIGSEATKENVLSKLSETTLIHIATYGSWEDSVLVFRPSPTSQPNQDGSYNEDQYQIGIKDIMNIQMKADLIVLSSCYGDIHRDVDFTLPSALLAAGCKCVVLVLWSIPDIARDKFWYHFYKVLQEGNFVSVAIAKAKQNLAEDERFTNPMYWAPFMLVGQDTFISIRTIKSAMLDQLVDDVEKDVLTAMPINALNVVPEPAEVSSKEITLPKLRQTLSELALHHVEHPTAIPQLLQLVNECIALLEHSQRDLLTRQVSQDAMLSPGAMSLLNLLGFHFQAKGAYKTDPYVVFPHWDHDELILPAQQALNALVDLSSNPACCSALARLLVGPEDALSGLLDIVSITKHTWEVQLKVTDIGVKTLWGHHISRDFLLSIGFKQVGVLLLFTNTSANRKLLSGSLHALAAVLGEKGEAMLDKVDINYLGVSSTRIRSASSSRSSSAGVKLPSLNPVLLSRNRIHMSTPWLSKESDKEETKEKMKVARSLNDLQSEYRYYMMKAHDWHNYSLKPQAAQAIEAIGQPKPKPKVVKVKAGCSASMDRVPVQQEPVLSLAGIEQRRDYSHFLMHSRSENVMARHREAVRKVFLPYVRKLTSAE